MATDAQTAKTFKVRVASVKRIEKDLVYAKKEVEQEKERLEKMQGADEPDAYRLRQQKQVIEESKAMVPDAMRRLKKAAEDLQMFMEREMIGEDLAELKEEAEDLCDKYCQ
eukprot:TRINITY_DN4979_c0_g1_i1.p1 TRINITY_DN4979_c0_g1~~TRINITY_DN4979_c0_g1_i1.p1  ORF type:complete len:111 (+),score=63.81 TRINITY_DN4979_c0_g1_i1:50-382(+)